MLECVYASIILGFFMQIESDTIQRSFRNKKSSELTLKWALRVVRRRWFYGMYCSVEVFWDKVETNK